MSNPYRKPLEDLHGQLDETRDAELHRDTRALMGRDDHAAAFGEHEGFRGRLERAVERYSASHPELARAAQNLLDVLNANGL